tara:strand:+ start:198 stop:827 length:630 start_codon:yes stop_codon:yes gene_type:complete
MKKHLKIFTHHQILPKIILGIGSLLIFISWYTQNYYTQAAEEELSKIVSSRQRIAFNEINKNMYSIFVNELQLLDTVDINKSVYSAYGYCLYATTVHHIGLSMATDDSLVLKNNNKIYENNLQDLAIWKTNKQLGKLMDFAAELTTWENKNGFSTMATFQNRFHELRDEAEKRAKRHLIIYIIGSLFLAFAFILQIRNEIKKTKAANTV